MKTAQEIANHFRGVCFGGNWTTVNLKGILEDISWQEAIKQVHDFNTIATLTYHVNYFVAAVSEVLEGKPLNAHDKFSFDHPPIESEEDWNNFLTGIWERAEHFASLIERLSDDKLYTDFIDPKYGNYYRNLHGIIEHMHYHLGQISLIKKLIRTK